MSTVLALTGAGPAQAAPPATSAPPPSGSVIVLLRDQVASAPLAKTRMAQRSAAVTAAQDSVLDRTRARASGAPRDVVHYRSANAFSATVTQAQADALAADPSVAQVIPNRRISLPARREASAVGTARATVPADTSKICPADPSKPLLEPEALTDTRTASDDPSVRTAQQLATGKGVKVAYIADGIDPANPDLIRPDGSRVITDYKAFSADGPAPEEGGAEAYGDASAIAAQGRVAHDLSTYVNPAYPLPTGCTIRIVGMAPGASIVALKTDFYTSSIIQAIDYATTTAQVDVLNESFGGNVIPDASSRSAISLFNDAAVAAGITVTVSSGDAGTTSTIGNPATDPKVISVAANTNNRGYAQTGYAGARAFGNGRWDNDQISSLSSGGFTQSGGTVDLTAPGESGWAICGGPECANYRGGSSDIQLFGGTSQSAPLTAGAAALVIQAYRSTHGGDSPSPARVKQLLTSTAQDLGFPAFEQGAGLLDARAAVEAALSYPGAKKVPAGVASNILVNKSQVAISGAPGSKHTAKLSVRNVGSKKLKVAVSTRDLKPFAASTLSTSIDASSAQTFPYPVTGVPWVYKKVTFSVPAGTDRLAAAMTWQGAARQIGQSVVTPVVRVSVFDPDGTYVANSRPQGGPVSANYANLDVRRPVAGTWTAVLYTVAGSTGYTGPITLRTTAERTVQVGSVNHATLSLKKGQKKTVKVRFTLPRDAGDTARSITLASSDGHQTSVPVVQRAVVPVSRGTGTFRGTITGGNARAGSAAQVLTYAFDVPKGTPDLGVGVTLADDPGIQLEGVLVDPNDETQSIGSNAHPSADDSAVDQDRTMQLNAAAPVPGRWRVLVLVQNPVTGKELEERLSGRIAFGQADARGSGLPSSTRTSLPQGQATTGSVTVRNTGIAPVNVQLDARTKGLLNLPLTSPFGSQSVQLPSHDTPTFLVPPGTTGLTATSTSDVPAVVELLSGSQGIDVVGGLAEGKKGSTVSSVSVTESKGGTVSSGIWYTDLNEIGAVGPQGSPAADGRIDVTARTRDFDTAVTSSTGDFWPVVTDPSADLGTAVTILPGSSATIPVTITPTAAVGTKVRGTLNVVTPPSFALPFATTGDLITSLDYAYTVGKASPAVTADATTTKDATSSGTGR